MKKKAIEKLPYKYPESFRGKYKYFVTASMWDVKGEETLIIDIFSKSDKKAPQIRQCYTEKAYETFFVASGEWKQHSIEGDKYQAYLWHSFNENMKNAPTKIQDEDIEAIAEFLGKKAKDPEKFCWTHELVDKERTIRWQKQARRSELRRERLREREANTPALPEDFQEYAESLFGESFVYYKRKGRYAHYFCSSCGKEYDMCNKRADSFEGQFEKVVSAPAHNERGECYKCHKKVIFKAVGKTKGVYGLSRRLFIGQQYQERGAVIRYFEAEKYFYDDAPEEVKITEIARAYFYPNCRVQIDYHKYDPYSGKEFWDDCNLAGMANINIRAGEIYPSTWENIKGTCLEYSAAREYLAMRGPGTNLINYMVVYHNYPALEMLTKMGLSGIVDRAVDARGFWGKEIKMNETDPARMFGIKKSRIKTLIETSGDRDVLKVLQLENELQQSWSDDEIETLVKLGVVAHRQDFVYAMSYMSLKKFIHRIEKYSGVENIGSEALCTYAAGAVKHATQTYLDYLTMRREQGYNMENSIILYPRDVFEEHQKLVVFKEKHEEDKHCKEKEELYPNIRKHYRRARKHFYYEDENYLIRPAKSATEIVMEGRLQHHCVGGDSYLSKHNRGESYILLMRFENSKETPYITIEMDWDYKIIQWYGAHDKKPDQEVVQKWLDAYCLRMKCKVQQLDEEAAVQALAYA